MGCPANIHRPLNVKHLLLFPLIIIISTIRQPVVVGGLSRVKMSWNGALEAAVLHFARMSVMALLSSRLTFPLSDFQATNHKSWPTIGIFTSQCLAPRNLKHRCCWSDENNWSWNAKIGVHCPVSNIYRLRRSVRTNGHLYSELEKNKNEENKRWCLLKQLFGNLWSRWRDCVLQCVVYINRWKAIRCLVSTICLDGY